MTQDSLQQFAHEKLVRLEAQLLQRELVITDRIAPGITRRGATQLISFACNDYLSLSRHPAVIQASEEATRRLGVGAGASRLVTGNHSLYQRLEAQLAQLKGTEDAVVFGSGYLTNIGVIPALLGQSDLILMDEACHSCLHAGATLARSHVLIFKHNDVDDAAKLLRLHRAEHRYCLLLTEGVFSMDGDRAPIATLLKLANEHDAWLMTDDAHGLGVVGDGRGSNIDSGTALPVPLQMGTLSKAVGAYGGYLCTSREVADLIRNRARSLIYSTGLPAGTVAAATKALEIIATDKDLVRTPIERARLFTNKLGLPTAQSSIVPLLLGSSERALQASERLQEAGYLVVAIRPPTVPAGTARLRCTFSAAHEPADVEDFASAAAKTLAAL
ncbi:MAG: aminotransferase class I/II-fold pyridoxal phosphate-dependent enzyme [Gammaproteobacteria bacterium]|nr:aminotransferase class I/II-fold pyridoxal phosphate-dependent enzyme [Gammaproteobacteria bacterium]